jgi:hypothetical protein
MPPNPYCSTTMGPKATLQTQHFSLPQPMTSHIITLDCTTLARHAMAGIKVSLLTMHLMTSTAQKDRELTNLPVDHPVACQTTQPM